MIAVLSLPIVKVCLCDVFITEDLLCHLVRGADDKEKKKDGDIHTDQDWDCVKGPSDNISNHLLILPCGGNNGRLGFDVRSSYPPAPLLQATGLV